MLQLVAAFALLFCPASELHVDETRGFQIQIPEGWSSSEIDKGEQGFALQLLPPGSIGGSALLVNVFERTDQQTADSLLEYALKNIEEGGDDFTDLEEWEDEILGRKARAIRVNVATPYGDFHMRQTYLSEGDAIFMIQRHAGVDDFEKEAPVFDEVIRSFAFVDVTDAGRWERKLAKLASRCGSEVDWAEDWDDAAARAEKENKLVLVVAFLIPGFAITDTPKTTLFMDEDVIELVNERYVPLWYETGMEGAIVGAYGMSKTAFGQGLLLATPSGDVVLESGEAANADVAYPFLLEGLRRNPDRAGPALPDDWEDLPAVERAEKRLARGELEHALELVTDDPSGRAQLLRARVLRLQRRGDEALAALASAREAGGVPETRLVLEEAGLLAREGRAEEAVARLDALLAGDVDGELVSAVRFTRGMLDLLERDVESAKRRWRELIEADDESRWAWYAASSLRSTFLDVDLPLDLSWPDADVLAELLTFAADAPLAPDRSGEAAEQALAWLLAAQREDGSWLSPTEITTIEEMGPEPMVDAITALCGRAMLRHGAHADTEKAARAALGYLLESIEEREETPPLVLFMDFMTWSNSMMLAFLTEALQAGIGDMEGLRPAANALVQDLATRQQEGGGWSYYVTNDMEGDGAPANSISFTTAAAILALAQAREAGFSVPDEVIDPAVSALERMRGDDGIFSYFLFHATDTTMAGTADPGSVGRGPACELALLRAGKSDPERLRDALDKFLKYQHLYAAEQGKVMMHAGPHGQGCHYLFFDYAYAALAQAELPADARTRTKLLELVLAARQPDGSFVDTPAMGRAYGTAMALIAFDALK